jgi:hypothetical protein
VRVGERRVWAALLVPVLGAIVLIAGSSPATQPRSRAEILLWQNAGLSAADLVALDAAAL